MKKLEENKIRQVNQTYKDYYVEIPEWVELMSEKRPDTLYHYYRLSERVVNDSILTRR